MKINKQKIEKSLLYIFEIFFVLSIIGEFVGYIIKNERIMIISMFLIFFAAVIYSIKDIRRRVIFLIFLMCFFTFLMGQYITKNNGVDLFRDSFEIEVRIHTILCIYISLLALLIGQILGKIIDCHQRKDEEKFFFLKNDRISLRKISENLFYATIIILYITLLERILYKSQYGYLEYIANFKSNIPFIISYIGTFSYVFFYIFLSTMPTKRKIIFPMVLYIIYLSLSLLTGSRSTFVLGCINLVLYLIIRDFWIENKSEKIITWRKVIFALVSIPIVIVGLNVYNTTRNGIQVQNIDFGNEINNFFSNQGSSLAIISLEKQYEDQLSEKRYPYIFYSIVQEVESKWKNSIYEPINNTDEIEEKLYQNNALATKISYLYYGNKIIKGHGLGSCYIAEAYADGGYFGVIIINLLFGILIWAFNKFIYKNWIYCTAILIVINQFMYVPRDPTFNWFNSLTAINLWIGILAMYFFTRKIEK